ncbi:spore coat protein JB [Clostridium cavendishii DSM 21758]|uniref:Spore coat protein JB n=1 Tax=Clostridium cavendishii DSM 21758 TaxID=1121302 RepID=A0A1M6N9B5_9CLOT|nr:spore coat protein CotJB [Clostridium cavendishii]SHJ92283.1 spore coat protein JB [Clostridium cavendishii DSM 21758]
MRDELEKMDKMELLKQISISQFMRIDLALYLNTHPNDKEAIKKYNNYAMLCKGLKETFEMNYGMSTQNDLSSSSCWEWINEPWPWEEEANFTLEKGEM